MQRRRTFWLLAFLVLLLCTGLLAPSLLWPRKVTRANFCRLDVGMSQKEVEAVFGGRGQRPDFLWGKHHVDEKLWYGDGVASVIFDEQGCLKGKCWSEPGFASPTKQSFDRVEVGMTLAEVQTLFGRPPFRSFGSPNNFTTEMWNDIDGWAGMDFDNGRVSQKWWSGGDYPLPQRPGWIHQILRSLRLE